MNFLTDVNFIIAVAAFFVGLLLMGVIAIVAVYFFTKQSRENFHKNMERSTDFILAKLGLDIAKVDLNTEQVKADVMRAMKDKETERHNATKKFWRVELDRKNALADELVAEQQKELVIQQKAVNALKEINTRQSLINAGINPNYVPPPPKGWWEKNFAVGFLGIIIFGLVVLYVLRIIGLKYGCIMP